MESKTVKIIMCCMLLHFIAYCSAEDCSDKLADCENYQDVSCKAPYKSWALSNCKKTCGLCDYTPPKQGNCADKMPNCDDFLYQFDDFCMGSGFAKDNCRLSCGFCDASELNLDPIQAEQYKAMGYPRPLPQTDSSTTEPQTTVKAFQKSLKFVFNPNECSYDGKKYQPGESWVEDCTWSCTCGKDTCEGLCQAWDFSKIPECYMEPPKPRTCCPTPRCPPEIQYVIPEVETQEQFFF